MTSNKLVLRKTIVGPSLDSSKGATVTCPDSHPFVFEGGAEATARIGFNALGSVVVDVHYPVVWLANHSLTHGWTAYALADILTVDDSPSWRYYGGSKSVRWKLTVWAECSSTRNKGAVHIRFKH